MTHYYWNSGSSLRLSPNRRCSPLQIFTWLCGLKTVLNKCKWDCQHASLLASKATVPAMRRNLPIRHPTFPLQSAGESYYWPSCPLTLSGWVSISFCDTSPRKPILMSSWGSKPLGIHSLLLYSPPPSSVSSSLWAFGLNTMPGHLAN